MTSIEATIALPVKPVSVVVMHEQLADIYEQALIREMAEDGFEPGAPPHITHHTLTVDGGIAYRMRCRSCERRHGKFLAFHRGSQYRAVSLCVCGSWREL